MPDSIQAYVVAMETWDRDALPACVVYKQQGSPALCDVPGGSPVDAGGSSFTSGSLQSTAVAMVT